MKRAAVMLCLLIVLPVAVANAQSSNTVADELLRALSNPLPVSAQGNTQAVFSAQNETANPEVLAALQTQIDALKREVETLISTITRERAQQGQNPTPAVTGAGYAQAAYSEGASPATHCVDITRNLYADIEDRSTNGEVSILQKFLSQYPEIYPEGSVTGYFGPATLRAVQRWQNAKGIVSFGDPDSTGYGFVGPRTRDSLKCVDTPPTSQAPTAASVDNPSVTITSPSSGDVLIPEVPFTITWRAENIPNDQALAFILTSGADLSSVSYLCARSLGDYDTEYRTVDAAKGSVTISSDWGNCGGGWYSAATLGSKSIFYAAGNHGRLYSLKAVLVPKNVTCTDVACLATMYRSMTHLGQVDNLWVALPLSIGGPTPSTTNGTYRTYTDATLVSESSMTLFEAIPACWGFIDSHHPSYPMSVRCTWNDMRLAGMIGASGYREGFDIIPPYGPKPISIPTTMGSSPVPSQPSTSTPLASPTPPPAPSSSPSSSPSAIKPYSVDLKVNGSDGPINLTGTYGGEKRAVTVSWASNGFASCILFGVSDTPSSLQGITNLGPSGSRTAYAFIPRNNETSTITLSCSNSGVSNTPIDGLLPIVPARRDVVATYNGTISSQDAVSTCLPWVMVRTPLSFSTARPTLTGTAECLQSLLFATVRHPSSGGGWFNQGPIPVVNGLWSFTPNNNLSDGTHALIVSDPAKAPAVLGSREFTVNMAATPPAPPPPTPPPPTPSPSPTPSTYSQAAYYAQSTYSSPPPTPTPPPPSPTPPAPAPTPTPTSAPPCSWMESLGMCANPPVYTGPDAVVGQYYSWNPGVSSSGNTCPQLPNGLARSSGTITGTPTAAGSVSAWLYTPSTSCKAIIVEFDILESPTSAAPQSSSLANTLTALESALKTLLSILR